MADEKDIWIRVTESIDCMMSQKDKLDKILIFQPFRGAWIAEWYQSAAPWAMSWARTQELWEEDEIKTGNTIINIIICNFFVNLCCLWRLENRENGIKHFLSPLQVRLKGWHWVDTMLQMKSSTQFMDCSSLIPMSILKGDRHLIFNCLPPVNLENYQIAYLWSTDIYTKTLEVIKMLACSRRPKTLGITRVVVLVAFLTINSFNDFAKLPLFLSLSLSLLPLSL